MPGFEVIGEEERAELMSIFDSGQGILFRHGFDALRNNSYKVRDFESEFANKFQTQGALAVSSGTAALRVALAALRLQPGDEVITQSFTFVATVEAIVESGATPVIAEVDDTLNMDPVDLERKISERTKAILPVHMLGVPADMARICEIGRKFEVPVIEDTAWGCGAFLNGQRLGTIGDIGCFSFDFAKTITTGEGGMVVAKNSEHLALAKAWHDHGHENNPSLMRWEDSRSSSGFNFRMSEMQGAVGIAQLRKLDALIHRQKAVHDSLAAQISGIPGVKLRSAPVGAVPSGDALVFTLKSYSEALLVRENLVKNGFQTKILPEAISWHFAGEWTHIPQLRLPHGNLDPLPESSGRLKRSVALPISVLDNGTGHAKIRDLICQSLGL